MTTSGLSSSDILRDYVGFYVHVEKKSTNVPKCRPVDSLTFVRVSQRERRLVIRWGPRWNPGDVVLFCPFCPFFESSPPKRPTVDYVVRASLFHSLPQCHNDGPQPVAILDLFIFVGSCLIVFLAYPYECKDSSVIIYSNHGFLSTQMRAMLGARRLGSLECGRGKRAIGLSTTLATETGSQSISVAPLYLQEFSMRVGFHQSNGCHC
jgi:hypothetical protein